MLKKYYSFEHCQAAVVMAILAIALVFIESEAVAFDGPLRVLLISQEEQEKQIEILYEVLSAHLKDYAVEIKIRRMVLFPPGENEQAELVKQAAFEEQAVAALWVNVAAHKLGLIVLESLDSGETMEAQVLVRELPKWSTTWQADCEAIASLARAVLISWLTHDNKEASMRCAGEILQAMDVEKPPVECPPPCPPNEIPLLTFTSHSAFSLPWALGTAAPMIGGAWGIGFLFKEYLGWRTQVGFFSHKSESTVTLSRVPLRFGPVLWWNIQRLGLGVSVEGISDFTRWSGPAPYGEIQITDRQVWGIGGLLAVRIRIIGDLYFWSEGGADFFDSKLRYLVNGEQISEYTPIQPRVSVGFELHTHLLKRAEISRK